MEPRGKPVTTSVPSISIKFHANAEQLEELYASDEEHTGNEAAGTLSATTGISEPDSSPLKYFPRLVKRSTSIDITPKQNINIDASPPSDPWRFFSDIKGKITKSVEEKITEIKSRNQEEGSPLKTKAKDNSKENSSVSDSEDLSESSISKTCGIVSTTEGAEMSSDDDTPSIEKDKKTEDRSKLSAPTGLRQRFRLLKPKQSKEGTLSKKSLTSLYNINTDKIEQALPEETDIESAVDALEDTNLQTGTADKVLKGIAEFFDNIKIDDENVVNIKEVTGSEVRQSHWASKTPKSIYAPVGFVDMRMPQQNDKQSYLFPTVISLGFIMTYIVIHHYSTYLAGFMVGVLITYICYYVKYLLDTPSNPAIPILEPEILQVPAVQEYQPLTKYEGWVNEYPDTYNPHTYHISQTQSVFLRLQGSLLRISHTKSKIPKRALWNEPKHKPVFTHHRIYNLLGAQVTLLPEGLAKKRHWSKKYPICVTLSKDQMDFEASPSWVPGEEEEDDDNNTPTKNKRLPFVKKKRSHTLRFSKLSEENEEFELDSESRASTPSLDNSENRVADDESTKVFDDVIHSQSQKEDDREELLDEEFEALPEDWGTFTPPDDDSPTQTKLYLFGRTDREKEDWFRRLKAATHKATETTVEMSVSHTPFTKEETDYIKYMLHFNKAKKHVTIENTTTKEELPLADVQWINAFVGRIMFDCLRDENFTQSIRNKIQKKLSSIKLPYFIEGLTVTQLSLGHTPPLLHKAGKPSVDERGLWIDIDVTYEGLIVLILQTKLNLMKLKQPPSQEFSRSSEKPAMFNSDVEDSAESTSDEENMCLFQNPALDSAGVPVQGLGGTSNTSKKFMKMVDRIAESKIFQAATEYRYIKKAMEGVSNTELRLRVEVKQLVGTLVLNVPPPPTDRVWIGFRPTPDLALHAQPIVGERNITYMRITSWIEKKLLLEFQKLMVIPNMEDFIIPVMSPKLPE